MRCAGAGTNSRVYTMTKLSTRLVVSGTDPKLVDHAKALEKACRTAHNLAQAIRVGAINANDFLNRLQTDLHAARKFETEL